MPVEALDVLWVDFSKAHLISAWPLPCLFDPRVKVERRRCCPLVWCTWREGVLHQATKNGGRHNKGVKRCNGDCFGPKCLKLVQCGLVHILVYNPQRDCWKWVCFSVLGSLPCQDPFAFKSSAIIDFLIFEVTANTCICTCTSITFESISMWKACVPHIHPRGEYLSSCLCGRFKYCSNVSS